MNLLSLRFWFNSRPGALSPIIEKGFAVFLIILIITFVIFLFLQKKKTIYRNLFRRLGNFSIANVIIGSIIMFFIYESVPLLSARFWILLWVISMIAWLAFILKRLKEIPKRKEELEKEKEFKRYIP